MGSKSKSKTQSTTQVHETTVASTDNRVTDSGAISLGDTTGNINILSTDQGALEAAEAVSFAALDVGSDAIEGATDVAIESIFSSAEIAEQSIDLGAQALEVGEDAISEAFGFGSDTLDGALDFGASALEVNSEISESALGFGVDLLEQNAGILGTAIDSNADLTEQSLEFQTALFNQSLGEINAAFQTSGENQSKSFVGALDFATRANTSEQTQLLQDALKFGTIAAGIIGAVFIFRSAK